MRTIWACLCAGDILLRREGADGAFSLPYGDEPPVALQPWSNITTLKDLSLNSEIALRVVRLDKPVVGVEGLEMMGLRKSHAVLSPEEYQLASKAAELLSQRKMSIAEVAYEVGFSNPNNFATAFKEMYGMPPTAYNEKHCSGSGAQP